jgi:predicted transglutaminase-like protease
MLVGRLNYELLLNSREMNLRHSLSTIGKILKSPIGQFGYWPTSNEIENERLRILAKRLKAVSYKETLTNILEWQQRNIEFWTERQPILPLLGYVLRIFSVAFVTYSVAFLVGIVLLIRVNIGAIASFAQTMLFLFWILITALMSIILTILVTIISILHSNRKIPRNEMPKALKNVVWPSISVDFLLDYGVGVCGDYAKMTACLLLNVYPDSEIYFVSAPSHVATGINVGNRLYMLDQRLPILTIDKWSDYRKPKKSDRIERFDLIKKTPRQADKTPFLLRETKYELNTENLVKKMIELLEIVEQPDDKTISLREPILVKWKNGAILYKENEMTDYSLARYLKLRISNELVKKEQITMVKAIRNDKDLIFQIYISEDGRR